MYIYVSIKQFYLAYFPLTWIESRKLISGVGLPDTSTTSTSRAHWRSWSELIRDRWRVEAVAINGAFVLFRVGAFADHTTLKIWGLGFVSSLNTSLVVILACFTLYCALMVLSCWKRQGRRHSYACDVINPVMLLVISLLAFAPTSTIDRDKIAFDNSFLHQIDKRLPFVVGRHACFTVEDR